MLTTKKVHFILAVILTILTIHLTSCRTTQRKEIKPIQIETSFPEPFDENGNPYVILREDGNVTMPLWYWLKITEYVVDVESNKELKE